MGKNFRDLLMNHDAKIVVWGVGYIGLSNLLHYGKKGISAIGIDIRPDIKELVKNKEYMQNFEYWLGFNFDYLLDQGVVSVTNDYQQLEDERNLVHLICVPTEKDGLPYLEPLHDVVEKIAAIENKKENCETVIVIESTLTPGTAEKIEKKLYSMLHNTTYFGVAPRRDWFLSGDKNLTNLPRVFGGNSKEASKQIRDVLSTVCNELVEASDYRYAEMSKSVENAYRHLDITFANQLSNAFPELDVREILKLAGTKWNVNTYYPSFGTAGYCIPLSSKYILAGAQEQEHLTLLQETVRFDENRPIEICQLLKQWGVSKVGILGISYKEDIKVDKHSAVLKMIPFLKENGIDVKLNDPYYTNDEINARCKIEGFDYLDYSQYESFDAIILYTAHKEYNLLNYKLLSDKIKNCKVIFDNTGMWEGREFLKQANVEYKLVGAPGWKNVG